MYVAATLNFGRLRRIADEYSSARCDGRRTGLRNDRCRIACDAIGRRPVVAAGAVRDRRLLSRAFVAIYGGGAS